MGYSIGQIRMAHLTASPFFGGPERQLVGLIRAMPDSCHSTVLCFMEHGKAQGFVQTLHENDVPTICLRHNHPHLWASAREIAHALRNLRSDVVLTHGYKPDIVGWIAARMAGIPVIMVSRGWTYATRKVRLNEALDRLVLRRADQVVCVSAGQMQKVVASGVRAERATVVHNSINVQRFGAPVPGGGQVLQAMFSEKLMHFVVAVGRLSPEKGFEQFIAAAAKVCARRDDTGFVLIGEGPLGQALVRQVEELKLKARFAFAGFRKDVDALLPHASLLVQSSYTEGMPNVVLEAMAGSLPVVATAVGGTPELVVQNETGLLVPPRDAEAIAEGVSMLLADSVLRARMGMAGRQRVEESFTFDAQAKAYARLVTRLLQSQPQRILAEVVGT